MDTVNRILILDYGSQFTQLIARRIREERVYREIHPGTVSADFVRAWRPKGIVLSGGPSSVYDPDVPHVQEGVLEQRGRPLDGEVGVNPAVGIAPLAAPKEADDLVGGPSRVADHPIDEHVVSPIRIAGDLGRSGQHPEDLPGQGLRDPLVGVDKEHPGARGKGEGRVTLARKADEGPLMDPRPGRLRRQGR